LVNVLVVDDDAKFREMLTEILEGEGYSVKCFETGKAAIAASNDELFNLALIDIRLPDMDGTEILSKLRKVEPETVKIIITGNATLDNSIEATNRGVDGYLVKPFNPQKLIKLIEGKLKEQAEKIEFDDEKVAEFIGMRHEWMSVAKLKGKR